MWRKVADCFARGVPIERYWNAGLSSDGTKCFLTDIDEYAYQIIDVNSGETLWLDISESPSILDNRPTETHVTIEASGVAGKYRLFGLGYNFPLLQHPVSDLRIHVDIEAQKLVLSNSASGKEIERLRYEAFSGDWAFATFSDDGSTVAVIEPYYVTFFRQTEDDKE